MCNCHVYSVNISIFINYKEFGGAVTLQGQIRNLYEWVQHHMSYTLGHRFCSLCKSSPFICSSSQRDSKTFKAPLLILEKIFDKKSILKKPNCSRIFNYSRQLLLKIRISI